MRRTRRSGKARLSTSVSSERVPARSSGSSRSTDVSARAGIAGSASGAESASTRRESRLEAADATEPGFAAVAGRAGYAVHAGSTVGSGRTGRAGAAGVALAAASSELPLGSKEGFVEGGSGDATQLSPALDKHEVVPHLVRHDAEGVHLAHDVVVQGRDVRVEDGDEEEAEEGGEETQTYSGPGRKLAFV